MTAIRDARGRFCTVPDLILDAACKKVLAIYRRGARTPFDREAAEEVLAEATRTADLPGIGGAR